MEGRVMFCANCYKEIPAGKSYTHTITLETSEGAETTEEQDNDE